jgi:hypothetical protein
MVPLFALKEVGRHQICPTELDRGTHFIVNDQTPRLRTKVPIAKSVYRFLTLSE